MCICVQCVHRQTHRSLRSGGYYRGVDHRGTRPTANRQALLINSLHTDASPLCLCVSLPSSLRLFSFLLSVWVHLLCHALWLCTLCLLIRVNQRHATIFETHRITVVSCQHFVASYLKAWTFELIHWQMFHIQLWHWNPHYNTQMCLNDPYNPFPEMWKNT